MKEIDKKFFLKSFRPDRQNSYLVISHILMEMFTPNSVIDFGCGLGWILYYFHKHFELKDLLGIEPNINIQYLDSNTGLKEFTNEFIYPLSLTEPLYLERKFDLAICFEVVEHFEDKYSDIAIENICRHSDDIVFSAAHPGQGGYGHINEQPKEYWIEKFSKNKFQLNSQSTYLVCNTMLKNGCKPWYWQNTMIFEKEE